MIGLAIRTALLTSLTSLAVGIGLVPRGSAAEPVMSDVELVRTAKALVAGLKTETLPNGLQVYLLPIPGAATVTTKLAYRVGSADEEPGQTGLSHYLEHLLFKGTDRLQPGDIDRLTQRHGGRNNAYTSEDITVYHFDFAADRWEIALEIEADRMRNTRIDERHEFEQEKGAVIAELKGGEDQPWDLEYKAILPLLFPNDSPYAHPVIGDEDHVRGATAEIIRRHYDKWYHPNNAALIVVGGFDPDRARARIRELFGPIPRGEIPERKPVPQPVNRTELLRKEIPSKFDVARLTLGFNTVPVSHPDDYVLDLLQQILTEGKTARLHRALVEEHRLANFVASSNNAGRYPGWFEIQVELLPGKDRLAAERLVFSELERLARQPIQPAELQRARRRLIAGLIFSRESIHHLADAIAQSVSRIHLDYFNDYLERIMKVTPADIQRVAGKYLKANQAVAVWSVPPESASQAPLPAVSGTGMAAKMNSVAPRHRRLRSSIGSDHDSVTMIASGPESSDGSRSIGVTFKNATRHVLENGLTVICLENRRLPVVVAEVAVAEIRLREPAEQSGIAALTGAMLEEGSDQHSGPEIAAMIESVGGSLVFNVSGGTVKVLSPDTALGLDLLFASLMRPSFPPDALERVREQQLSAIAEAETQPRNRARNRIQQLIYGEHPLGRPSSGRREIVEKLTVADLKRFHQQHFAPNRATVVVVGDFDTPTMLKAIQKRTADWKPMPITKLTLATPPVRNRPLQELITDPTAAQTHIYLGHLGITRNHPDYYALAVMDNVLGTGPGFTDRLSATLRDRQGLAYTVTAQITGSASDQPGMFLGYIGTFPDKFTWVRDSFLREIERIRNEPATVQEVEDAKNYLLGSLPFRLETNAQIAEQLLAAERYGLGFEMLEDYRREIAKVTPAEVQRVAKKFLRPQSVVIVAVGPIDAEGRPLPKNRAAAGQ